MVCLVSESSECLHDYLLYASLWVGVCDICGTGGLFARARASLLCCTPHFFYNPKCGAVRWCQTRKMCRPAFAIMTLTSSRLCDRCGANRTQHMPPARYSIRERLCGELSKVICFQSATSQRRNVAFERRAPAEDKSWYCECCLLCCRCALLLAWRIFAKHMHHKCTNGTGGDGTAGETCLTYASHIDTSGVLQICNVCTRIRRVKSTSTTQNPPHKTSER